MEIIQLNLYAAWIGILLGIIAGAVQGMFFHDEKWLGGYGTWRRRMIRLGHISLFGIGFINALFAFTVVCFDITGPLLLSSLLLVIGAITMPLVCYLSAFKKFFRHLFFIPVLSILVGTGIFVIGGVTR